MVWIWIYELVTPAECSLSPSTTLPARDGDPSGFSGNPTRSVPIGTGMKRVNRVEVG